MSKDFAVNSSGAAFYTDAHDQLDTSLKSNEEVDTEQRAGSSFQE
jgi:hypothetical protein